MTEILSENFFSPEAVDAAFDYSRRMKVCGEGEITYFAHLDPAVTSHNYALAIVHKEGSTIVLDHLKIWNPPLIKDDIDDYVIQISKKFNLGKLSYDQWNCTSSIERLNHAGVPAVITRFSKSYKTKIYDELYKLVGDNKLKLPFDKTLHGEMINLQRKFYEVGYRTFPKSEGDVRTDDAVDALAGAIAHTMERNERI